ncbi:MAG: winged helix-turn-helix domain-containing protein [Myxococcota bacterium]
MGRGEPEPVSLGGPLGGTAGQELDLDLVRRRIRVGDRRVGLTELEARLLGYLAARPNVDVARAELLAEVWGYAPTSTTRAVDFVVRRLRAKLGDDGPVALLTAHGVGYRLIVAGRRSEIRLPTGVIDAAGRRFVPDVGEPVPLGGDELAVLLRLLGVG